MNSLNNIVSLLKQASQHLKDSVIGQRKYLEKLAALEMEKQSSALAQKMVDNDIIPAYLLEKKAKEIRISGDISRYNKAVDLVIEKISSEQITGFGEIQKTASTSDSNDAFDSWFSSQRSSKSLLL